MSKTYLHFLAMFDCIYYLFSGVIYLTLSCKSYRCSIVLFCIGTKSFLCDTHVKFVFCVVIFILFLCNMVFSENAFTSSEYCFCESLSDLQFHFDFFFRYFLAICVFVFVEVLILFESSVVLFSLWYEVWSFVCSVTFNVQCVVFANH